MLDPRRLELAHRTAVRWFRMTWRYGRHISWDWEFESPSLQRRVVQTSFRPPALVTSDSGRAGGAGVLMAGEGIYDMTLQFQRCHRQQGGADRQDHQDYLSWRR